MDPMGRFLRKLYKMGKISPADCDRERGKQSGYPRCCVEYYIRIASVGLPPAITTSMILGDTGAKYVQCPQCRGFDIYEQLPISYAIRGRVSSYTL